jgi:excisionase family DNA binding protein
VTSGWEDRELDRAGEGERASARHQAARRAAPAGGSNRLLSVQELAAYLSVPKKTVYICWRQWGLRGYRVGRHLRFRQRRSYQEDFQRAAARAGLPPEFIPHSLRHL